VWSPRTPPSPCLVAIRVIADGGVRADIPGRAILAGRSITTGLFIARKAADVRKWALLLGAIGTEVTATLSLRAAQDHSLLLLLVVAGYVASFSCLTLVLRAGMPVGVAYGIWGALGTAVTAVLAAVIFGDPFTTPIIVGIGLIIAGVLMVELGSRRAEEPAP